MVKYPLSSCPLPQLGQRRASPRFSPVQIDFSSAIYGRIMAQVDSLAKRSWWWALRCRLEVEGLADTEVCIGDRFRVGGAVVEVSHPCDTF
jgi:hypothetical protein